MEKQDNADHEAEPLWYNDNTKRHLRMQYEYEWVDADDALFFHEKIFEVRLCEKEKDFGFDPYALKKYDSYNTKKTALYCPDVPEKDKVILATTKKMSMKFNIYRCDKFYDSKRRLGHEAV